MYYSEITQPRLNDYDAHGLLSYEAILQLLENVSAHHATKVHDKVAHSGIAWILLEWNIEILNRPRQFRELDIRTWVRETPPSATTYRDFLICDTEGREMIKASSRFALLDTDTGRMTKISDELLRSYEPEDESVFEEDGKRLSEPESFDSEAPIVLRRTDIDYNGHVHNTRYIDFALDALPEEACRVSDYHRLRILYRSAVSFDSDPVIKHAPWEDGHFFCIYKGDHLCTMIELK